MIVLFQSECEKKALKRTRQVLDLFANRIGQRSWVTTITQDGLNAIRSELTKTATKNTAVSCLLQKSNGISELQWIVGNRGKFNNQGHVPVNRTNQNVLSLYPEEEWSFLPLIEALVAFSALFHDVGKCNDKFQEKLSSIEHVDYYRHELVSVFFLIAFIKSSNAKNDEDWIKSLADGEFNETNLKKLISSFFDIKNIKLDIVNYPFFILVSWLIISHHRLPGTHTDQFFWKEYAGVEWKSFLPIKGIEKFIKTYINKPATLKDLEKTLAFSKGFPFLSDSKWRNEIKNWSIRVSSLLDKYSDIVRDSKNYYKILNLALNALMLGDHYYSSEIVLTEEKNVLYANTVSEGRKNQTIVNHLIGVEKQSLTVVHMFPIIHAKMPRIYDIPFFNLPVPTLFIWQKRIVEELKKRNKNLEFENVGVFIVNQASTGCGKTLANAKFMNVISSDFSLRATILLGLRTLTLQTGKEFREKIGLDDTQEAVVIGSRAFAQLVDSDIAEKQEEELDVDFSALPSDFILKKVFKDSGSLKFLYAPVLICTIDQMMKATECIGGGKGILATLRLLSSDIIIDEIDDYVESSLIAVSRLVYLAGVFGRKVIISSATVPPEISEGLFAIYQKGWNENAVLQKKQKKVISIICDEFSTRIDTVLCDVESKVREQYRNCISVFLKKRIDNLTKAPVFRRCNIVEIDRDKRIDTYFDSVINEINHLHDLNYETDKLTGKQISFGLVRFSNISQCVAFSKYLISKDANSLAFDYRMIVYHARQVMLVRHEIEKYLDSVLNRKDPELVFKDPIIRKSIDESNKKLIFLVVSSPVEELGRDHDFDFAIIEPSSLRSIIQTAGRVQRHRKNTCVNPNIGILQYNLKAFFSNNDDEKKYLKPGFEIDTVLPTHDVSLLYQCGII